MQGDAEILAGRSSPRTQPGIEPFTDSLYSLLLWLLREPSSGEKSASLAHAMSDIKFSNSELKVQAIARRRANAQLLRVPWSRFRKAYEEYPRWQEIALWIQAVSAAQDSVPSWLIDDLRKLCPGFVGHEATSHGPKVMGLNLLEWAHNHEFAFAKRQGWLDALTFYGVRHPRSECAWAYWEHCENQWAKRRPDRFPTFEAWRRQAQNMRPRDKISYRDLGKAVEKYLDWEALALWLRPLLASDVKLPRRVISELDRRCPGALGAQNSGSRRTDIENVRIWKNLVEWGRVHCQLQAGKEGWLDLLLQRARTHPLHVRVMSYGKQRAREQPRTGARSYPSFRQWLQIAQWRLSQKRIRIATNRPGTITMDDLRGEPGFSHAASQLLVELQPTTILQALRMRGVGRKTATRLFALGLLTDPEGLWNREPTLAELRGK